MSLALMLLQSICLAFFLEKDDEPITRYRSSSEPAAHLISSDAVAVGVLRASHLWWLFNKPFLNPLGSSALRA